MHAMHMREVEYTMRRGLCTQHDAWINHTEKRCRQLGELGQKKGRSSIRLAPSPLSVPFGGKGLAPIHSRGPLAAALRRSSVGLLQRIRSIGRYTLNASPP